MIPALKPGTENSYGICTKTADKPGKRWYNVARHYNAPMRCHVKVREYRKPDRRCGGREREVRQHDLGKRRDNVQGGD